MKKAILLHNCDTLGAFELRLIDGIWCIYHTIRTAVRVLGKCVDYSAAYEILRLAVEISYNYAAAEASAELGIEIY